MGSAGARIALFTPFADFFALILTLVWILVVSVKQFRDKPGTGFVATPDVSAG